VAWVAAMGECPEPDILEGVSVSGADGSRMYIGCNGDAVIRGQERRFRIDIG